LISLSAGEQSRHEAIGRGRIGLRHKIEPHTFRGTCSFFGVVACRQSPATAGHHGRIVKRTGDGSIIEFRSVVDAVRCASGGLGSESRLGLAQAKWKRSPRETPSRTLRLQLVA